MHGELDKWSLVQITLNLIESALENEKQNGIEYKYFMLLSGQDYPIKKKEYILNFLEKQYPKPLIDICEICKIDSWGGKKFLHVSTLNKIDAVYKKHPKGLLRKIKVAPLVIKQRFLEKFIKTPFEKLDDLGLTLSIGSAWWILPREIITFTENFVKTNKKAVKIYKKTWTPEETFFQTMVVNHELYKLYDEKDEIFEKGDQKCMTFANFFTPTKGFRGHPHDILTEDFDRIMAKKQLFARKFNMDVDAKVLDMIDEAIKE